MAYEEQDILNAIQAAKKEINYKTKKVNSYIRGYNDCFALLIAYEQHLRKDKSKFNLLPFCSNYKNHEDFIFQLSTQGYASLDELAKIMLFEPVKDRIPKTGDIAYEERYNIGSAMIAEKNYWISTTENKKGVKACRKLLFKEIRPIILARPIYI